MSTAENYFKAAHPNPPRCIGLQLRPYSLGHHVALRASDSSFLKGDGEVYRDLILGVFICSQTWAEWHAWRRSWKLPVFLKIWGWCYRKFDIKSEYERFVEYLKEGEAVPELSVPMKGRTLVSSWENRIKLFLVREMGLKVDEAMDYPLALAWEEYCAFGEREGFLTLTSDSDIESLEFASSDRCKEMLKEAQEAARKEQEKN